MFGEIYNSRNYSILLNIGDRSNLVEIYNSRNYSILLNMQLDMLMLRSTTVEIILYYLTLLVLFLQLYIYNSRNYSILLNCFTGIDGIGIYNSRNYSILLNYNQTESELNHLQQ